MKKISLFLFIFISIFLFNSCRIDDKEAIYLESGWSYSIDSIDGEYKPIDINQFPYIAKLCPKRKGHIYLKNDFILPSSLSDEVLKCFFGNIKIANEFYFNGQLIGSNGFFEPQPFTIGELSCSYNLPSNYCKYDETNEIILNVYVDYEGKISEIPFISTETIVRNYQNQFDFVNSKLLLTCSCLTLLTGLIYLFMYYLKRKEKANLSFALLNIFSSLYLAIWSLGEYPIIFSNNYSYLLFLKLFKGIASMISSYFAVSFIRDFLNMTDSLSRKIYRAAITIGPSIFILFSQDMHEFYLYLVISYLILVIHIFYAVKLIFIAFKNHNKKVYILLLGFSPILITILITGLLILFKRPYYSIIIILGWQFVIMSFLCILVVNFTKMSTKVEFLNENLEKLVQDRTLELTKINTELEESNSHLQYEKERTEKEIELASFVQQSFYNTSIPELKNFEIAYYNKAMAGVSGDFYDFYFHDNVLDGFGVFDVSGHGISSGLVTMLVKNIINEEFSKGKKIDLDKVMTIINERIINDKGNIENYLTGILARIKNKEIEFVNAGHPFALVLDGKTNEIHKIQRGDADQCGVIGISEFPVNFETVKYKVKKGDIIMLYTDGITEMMNRNREEFGFERLVKTFTKHSKLPLQECMNTVIDDVITFGNKEKLSDDLTMLLIKCK